MDALDLDHDVDAAIASAAARVSGSLRSAPVSDDDDDVTLMTIEDRAVGGVGWPTIKEYAKVSRA
jgi:hypothetical protein